MLGYLSGVYDILRINDLERIDKAIQENIERGNKYFALAIYDDKLCEELGFGTPLKKVEDRTNIAKYLSGVDFTFSISSTNSTEINQAASVALTKYISELKQKEVDALKKGDKKYNMVYAPGTYDLFHAGHLENLLAAAGDSKKIIVGVKSDELVEAHKGRLPIITAQERMEILRHFKFVNGVYQYHTRDPHIAVNWIKAKYGEEVDAIYLGSDLKNDFKDIKDIELVFTDRDPNMTRSTTNYRKKLTLLKPSVPVETVAYTSEKIQREDNTENSIDNGEGHEER